MPIHTLYAYVDGADLDQAALFLSERFQAFIASRKWSRETWFVDKRHPRASDSRSGDLPMWDLGLNHELPDPGTESPGWFDEVEVIATFLGQVAGECDREFVIGIHDKRNDIAEDLHTIREGRVDLPRLKAIIGIAPPGEGAG